MVGVKPVRVALGATVSLVELLRRSPGTEVGAVPVIRQRGSGWNGKSSDGDYCGKDLGLHRVPPFVGGGQRRRDDTEKMTSGDLEVSSALRINLSPA
jgi:hypothetical protein